MTTFFISRHPGARDWAAAEGIEVDAQLDHLDTSIIQPGDVVIGTLPINLVAEVCARSGRYLHLSLDLPANLRGQELAADDMRQCKARLEEYRAVPIVGSNATDTAKPHLFIAVATGQGVANLPPILEYGSPGDAVLWVESPQAEKGQWNLGINQVLTKAGFEIIEPVLRVSDINDPVEMRRVMEVFLRENPECYQNRKPVIVANGGNKLSPIGLLGAWEPYQPVILYGNDQPTTLRVFPRGLVQPPRDQSYQHHQLHLRDILLARGYSLYEKEPAMLLWPAGSALPQSEPYGIDPDFTQKIHQEHYQSGHLQKNFPDFEQFSEWNFNQWLGSLEKLFNALSGKIERVKSQKQSVLDLLRHHPEKLKHLYSSTRRLMEDASSTQVRQEQAISLPRTDLSALFEGAVARRLLDWLRREPDARRVIQSAWKNVSICQNTTPHIKMAEWDLVLVLKNGILLYIECKAFSGTASQKELDARLLNLQQASSNLARMIICTPIYTQFCNEKWFHELYGLKYRVESVVGRHSFLPFTLPDQPKDYTLKLANCRQIELCPSFEEVLAQMLKPYVGDLGV